MSKIEQLRELVRQHLANTETPLVLAVAYSLEGEDYHLFEVAENLSDPGDASWDRFEFLPPPEWEANGAKLVIVYIGPREFWRAVSEESSRGHALMTDVAAGYEILYRDERSADAARIVEKLEELRAVSAG